MSALANLERPLPPDELWDAEGGLPTVLPDRALGEWIHQTFISGFGPLVHEAHAHLQTATFGCMWTNAANARNQREIVGQAEIFRAQGPRWSKVRQEQQLREWFGTVPDFLLTFYAPYVNICDDAAWCALVEHELCHCAQMIDKEGMPMMTEDGDPRFALRGHDVEEFVHVVARYGIEKGAGMSQDLVTAAMRAPSVAQVDIRRACGTCLKMAA